MDRERILSRRLEKLDRLKTALISRGDKSKDEIIEEIIEVEEDLEAILMDLGYINDEETEDQANYNTYRRYTDVIDEY